MPKPTRPAKPPKPAMRWGVYSKEGNLIDLTETRRDAGWWWPHKAKMTVSRVMVTPIASKGAK